MRINNIFRRIHLLNYANAIFALGCYLYYYFVWRSNYIHAYNEYRSAQDSLSALLQYQKVLFDYTIIITAAYICLILSLITSKIFSDLKSKFKLIYIVAIIIPLISSISNWQFVLILRNNLLSGRIDSFLIPVYYYEKYFVQSNLIIALLSAISFTQRSFDRNTKGLYSLLLSLGALLAIIPDRFLSSADISGPLYRAIGFVLMMAAAHIILGLAEKDRMVISLRKPSV